MLTTQLVLGRVLLFLNVNGLDAGRDTWLLLNAIGEGRPDVLVLLAEGIAYDGHAGQLRM